MYPQVLLEWDCLEYDYACKIKYHVLYGEGEQCVGSSHAYLNPFLTNCNNSFIFFVCEIKRKLHSEDLSANTFLTPA